MEPNRNKVIVVGGGIAGLSAATAVADAGLDVVLVVREKHLGGHAAEWACMATDECAKCSACLVQDQIRKAVSHPRVQVILGGEVVSCQGQVGDYRLRLEPAREEELGRRPWTPFVLDSGREVRGSCVVLATGFEAYDASKNPLLGYGQLEGVVTTRDLDRVLGEDDLASFLPEKDQPPHLAFIQCVGSRDRKSGREYCSQFCCRTTIRLANRLLYLRPEAEITVFYIDLQVMSKDFATFYRQAQKKIRFIQGVPAEVTRGSEKPLRVVGVAPGSDRAAALEFDRVVLGVGFSPTQSHADLARIFGVGLNEFGYFDAGDATAELGIFPVGGCAGPADIQGSRKQALAAAARVVRLMGSRPVSPAAPVSEDAARSVGDEDRGQGLVGVLVETGDGSPVEVLSPERARKILAGQEGVRVFEAPSWSGPGAVDRIDRLCEEEALSRVVICGPSSATSALPEWLGRTEAGAAPVPVTYAATRDHCGWVEKDAAVATAKAERLLKMAVAGARAAILPVFKEVPVERTVAVIGGNQDAYEMASCLLSSGFPVLFLKTDSPSGGPYAVPETLVKEVLDSPSVRLVEDAVLDQVEGAVGSYRLRLVGPGGRRTVTVGAVVLAVDASSEPAELDAPLGESGRVMSLREYGELVTAGRVNGQEVCIWLDREGPERRDAGRAALRYAGEHARLGGKPTVLYSNMPVYGQRGQVLCDEARAAGVRFINYTGQAPGIHPSDGGLAVTVTDSVLPDRVLEFRADHLVVPASTAPPAENRRLANLFRQPLDGEGYLPSGNVKYLPVGSARRGIFFVGGGRDESDPEDARVDALAVLAELTAFFPEGNVQVPSGRVVIDSLKCAKCLTCLRFCPHGAIQLSSSRDQMEMLDPACYHCGICAASCPGAAIEHSSLGFGQMQDVLEVAAQPLFGRAPVVAFACRQSAIPAAGGAGLEGLTLPPDVVLVEVPCAGLVGENVILEALVQGARGVLVLGCHHDNCRSLWGSDLTTRRVMRVQGCLEEMGMSPECVRFYSFGANESHRLAHVLAQAVESLPAGGVAAEVNKE